MADIIISTRTLKDKNPSYWTGGTPSAPYLCPIKSTLTSYFVSGAITVSGTYTDKLLVCAKDISAVTRSVTGTTTEYLNVFIEDCPLEDASGLAVSGDIAASGGKRRAKAIVTYLQRTKTTYNYGSPSYTAWENKSATIYGDYVEGSNLGTTIKNRTKLGNSTPWDYVAGATRTGKTVFIYLAANLVTSLTVSASLSYSNISAGATSSGTPTKSAKVTKFYYTSGSTSTTAPSSTYGSLSAVSWSGSYTLANTTTNGFTGINSSTGVLTSTSRGTSYSTSTRTSATVTGPRATFTWTHNSDYGGSTATGSATPTATCTLNKNVITNITWSGGSGGTISNTSHTAGASTVNCASKAGATTPTTGRAIYSSGSTASITLSSYGTWGSVTYSWSVSGTGFSCTSSNATSLNITAASRGTTYSASTRTATITRAAVARFTLNSTYNNGLSYKDWSASATATATLAANTITLTAQVNAGSINSPGSNYPASGATYEVKNNTGASITSYSGTFSSGSAATVNTHYTVSAITYSWSSNLAYATLTSANTSYINVTMSNRSTTLGSARSATITRTATITLAFKTGYGGSGNGNYSKACTGTVTLRANILTWSFTTQPVFNDVPAGGGSSSLSNNPVVKGVYSSGASSISTSYNTTTYGTWAVTNVTGISSKKTTLSNRTSTGKEAYVTFTPKDNKENVLKSSYVLIYLLKNVVEKVEACATSGNSHFIYSESDIPASGGSNSITARGKGLYTFTSKATTYDGNAPSVNFGGSASYTRKFVFTRNGLNGSIDANSGYVTLKSRGTVEGARDYVTIKGTLTIKYTHPSNINEGASVTSEGFSSTVDVYLAANEANASYTVEAITLINDGRPEASGGNYYTAVKDVKVRGYYSSGATGNLYNASAYTSEYSGSVVKNVSTKVSHITGISTGDKNKNALHIYPSKFITSLDKASATRLCATDCKVVLSNVTVNNTTLPGSHTFTISSKPNLPAEVAIFANAGEIYLDRGIVVVKMNGTVSLGNRIIVSEKKQAVTADVDKTNQGQGWNIVTNSYKYISFVTYPLVYYYNDQKVSSSTLTTLYMIKELDQYDSEYTKVATDASNPLIVFLMNVSASGKNKLIDKTAYFDS